MIAAFTDTPADSPIGGRRFRCRGTHSSRGSLARSGHMAVTRNLYKEPPPGQVGGPAKTQVSAWFSAVPGGFRRASWSAHTGDFSVWFSSARRRPPRATALSDWLFSLDLPRQCAGESAGTSQCYKREPRDRGKYPRGSGSPMMRPKSLPDSESHTGKTRRSLCHQSPAESRHTPPRLRIARPRFLGDGVLAQRE